MKLPIEAKKNEQGEYIFQGQPLHVGDDLVPRRLRTDGHGRLFINRIKGIEEVDGKVYVDLEKVEVTSEQTQILLKLMKKI